MHSISTIRAGSASRFTPINALVGRSVLKYLHRSSFTRWYSSTSGCSSRLTGDRLREGCRCGRRRHRSAGRTASTLHGIYRNSGNEDKQRKVCGAQSWGLETLHNTRFVSKSRLGLCCLQACPIEPLQEISASVKSYCCGSILMIDAPRLLPIQRTGRLAELSMLTRRILVVCGSRYSMNSSVLVFSRATRSLLMPPVQA